MALTYPQKACLYSADRLFCICPFFNLVLSHGNRQYPYET